MAKTSWAEQFVSMGVEIDELTTTMTDEQMNVQFNDGYGGSEGCAFTAWNDEYVFFPIVYDGSEWIGRAPRNPCDKAMSHQGGE